METPKPSSRPLAASTSSRKRPLDSSSPPSASSADLTASALRRTHLSSAFSSTMSARASDRQVFAAQERARALESDLSETRARLAKVEADRAWLVGKEQEVRERAEREVSRMEGEREREEAEMRRLRKAEVELSVRLAEREEEVERLRGRGEREREVLRGRVEMLEREKRGAEEMLEEVRAREEQGRHELGELRMRVLELEEDALDSSHHQLSSPRAGLEDLTLIRTELSRQSSTLRTLESENARLKLEMAGWRERAREAELVREENRDLRRRAREAEGVGREVARLRLEVETRTRELEHLTLPSPDSSDPHASPTPLTAQLATLRLSQASLLSQTASLTTRLSELEAARAGAEERAEEAERARGAEERRRREAEGREGRERRARELGERQVANLEALLASYTAEAAQLLPSSPSSSLPAFDTLKSARIAQLEQLVDALKSENATLLAELNFRPAEPEPAVVPLAVRRAEEADAKREAADQARLAAEHELEALRKSMQTVEAAREEVEQKLFELNHAIGEGSHVPPRERVLQMTSNPVSDHFAVRARQLDELRAERDALLRKRLEMGEGEREWVPRESWEQVRREKEDLVEEARGREKRMLRLKQVFAAKATEFREAVTSILGYKLNFSGNGRVRLTSIYDPSTALVFQSSDDNSNTGSMRLIGIGEDGGGLGMEGQGVEGGMQFWVRERGSIPCFLAALTIECFEKTTVGRNAGWIAPGAGGGEEGVE